MIESNTIKTGDVWSSLKNFTSARIGLGRHGISVPSKEMLQFKMDHALARTAVFSLLDMNEMPEQLKFFKLPLCILKSKAADKHIYLKRPDLGRRLHEDSIKQLQEFKSTGYDMCIVITGGLSATAVNRHCMHVLSLLMPMLAVLKMHTAPICLVEHGRVAVADETASLLQSKLALILIGERPGLSANDSLSAYITYDPVIGLTDERRNCISNIRPEGLPYKIAADKILYLIKESMRLQLSGIALKENSNINLHENIIYKAPY